MQKRLKQIKPIKFLKAHQESLSFKLKKAEKEKDRGITYKLVIKRNKKS